MTAAERIVARGHQLFDQFDRGLITARDLERGLRLLRAQAWDLLWAEAWSTLAAEADVPAGHLEAAA